LCVGGARGGTVVRVRSYQGSFAEQFNDAGKQKPSGFTTSGLGACH
jgi:hypothetical protein